MPRAWDWLSCEPQVPPGTPQAGTAMPGPPWHGPDPRGWQSCSKEEQVKGAGAAAPFTPKQWVGAEGAPGKPTGQDSLSLGSAFPDICACGHGAPQGRGHVGSGSIFQRRAKQKCQLPAGPSPCHHPKLRRAELGTLPRATCYQCRVPCTRDGPLQAIGPCARSQGFHLAGAGMKSSPTSEARMVDAGGPEKAGGETWAVLGESQI